MRKLLLIEKIIITATNGIEIDDLKKSLNIQGEEITFDRKNNIITATNGIEIDDLKITEYSRRGNYF